MRPVPALAVPRDELAAIKARARKAYLEAKERNAAPALLCDRWYSGALLATHGEPERVQATLLHRTELLFKLLLDRQQWLARDADAP